MTDSVILTGGTNFESRVQEYNLQGSVARLPDLNTNRRNHACGHYVHNGLMVSLDLGSTYKSRIFIVKERKYNNMSTGVHCQWRSGKWVSSFLD